MLRSLTWFTFALAACNSSGEQPPDDWTITVWHGIPSVDGTRLAVVIEPRHVHATNDDMHAPYVVSSPGAAVAVDAERGDSLGTLATGRSSVLIGASRAWVLQSDGRGWQAGVPSDSGFFTFAQMSRIDRATLQVTAPVALDPPLETPVAIGDTLFDVVRGDTIESDLAVRVRDDNGAAMSLHTGRGFGTAWCTGDAALVYAYELSSAVRIVVVRRDVNGAWQATQHDLPELAFTGLACDARAARVALAALELPALAPKLIVYDLATATTAFTAPGLGAPLALRGDGQLVVATSTANRHLVRVDATGATPLTVTAQQDSHSPAVVADQAAFALDSQPRLVDLSAGAPGIALAATGDARVDLVPWPDAGGFAIARSHGRDDIGFELDELGLATITGAVALPLPPTLRFPTIVAASGTQLYTVTNATIDEPLQLHHYDLATRALIATTALPSCDDGVHFCP